MLSIGEIKQKIEWHKEEIRVNEERMRVCEGKINNSKRELELYKQDLLKSENLKRQKESSSLKKIS